MFSYIIGLFAVLLFFSSHISLYIYPQSSPTHRNLSKRPQLNESLLAINKPNDTAPECPPDSYIAHVLNSAPLVIYLENFLSGDERQHLLDISKPLFEPSTISNDGHATLHDRSIRDSSVALIPRTNTTLCIEQRALALQGYRRDIWLERLRTQRYGPGGHYSHHFDWTRNSGGWGRVSSFMAWVAADEGLVGGGTEFPMLRGRSDLKGKICKFVECPEGEEDGEEKGTVFKVMPGNAVYWENFAADGRGYDETWHAALPVEQGVKIGLNIWTFGRIE